MVDVAEALESWMELCTKILGDRGVHFLLEQRVSNKELSLSFNESNKVGLRFFSGKARYFRIRWTFF
jgi:hypothetical protein